MVREINQKKDRQKSINDNKTSENVRETPLLLTWMVKNIFDEYPERGLMSVCGDVIVRRMIIKHGKECIVNSVSPAIYRRHENGIYSSMDNINRQITMADSLSHAYSIVDDKGEKIDIKKDISRNIFSIIVRSFKRMEFLDVEYKKLTSCVKNIYKEGILTEILIGVIKLTQNNALKKLRQIIKFTNKRERQLW
jgi:hypothetical protein